MKIWSSNPADDNFKRALWLHEQLEHQLSWGFKDLKGYGINQGPIKIIEYPEIAQLTDQRLGNHVYVKSLYAWVYANKGINEDSHDIVRRLAMFRLFKTVPEIPTLAKLMGIETNARKNY